VNELASTMQIAKNGVIDRLYVLNAGVAIAPDRSMYSPGYGRDQPITLSCNAYLIRRADEWMLWDTGIEDALASLPGGKVVAHGIRGIVEHTIESQLAQIGLKPTDITRVFLSHAHFDHVGNASLFAHATWYLQRKEYDAMFATDPERYGYVPALYRDLKGAKFEMLEGDLDVFGDGSVLVLATPGHTLGHSCLLVRLRNTGAVVLSGDVAHLKFTLCNCCVPTINADTGMTKRSMARIKEIVRDEDAQLWINHDAVQNATILHAPAFYD
jgi:N-acyl homoserine lactone hydrolase